MNLNNGTQYTIDEIESMPVIGLHRFHIRQRDVKIRHSKELGVTVLCDGLSFDGKNRIIWLEDSFTWMETIEAYPAMTKSLFL